jgi:hypothetical protein
MVILMNMSVFQINHGLKKVIKLVFLNKKTEPKPVQIDRFRFGYFRTKTSFFLLGFFWFGGFSGLARVFFSLAPFFLFSLVFLVSCL